jgi:hypothetical protein
MAMTYVLKRLLTAFQSVKLLFFSQARDNCSRFKSFLRLRAGFPFLVLAWCLGSAVPTHAQTIDFTDRAAFTAATTNLSRVGFAGILPPGAQFGGYSQLDVPGVSFSTPVSNTFVNVTTAGYYSPNVYPSDFIVDSVNQETGQPNPNNTLFITLTQPTFAIGLDVGGLGFSGMGTGTITLSNGHFFSIASLPTVGNTMFVGFISTQPITNLTFATTNDSWVVGDVLIASPIISPCTFSLSPSGQKFGSDGGLGSFFLNTGVGCNWQLSFSNGWISAFNPLASLGGGPPSGTGPRTVTFTVAPNSGAGRTGTISVGNQSFNVTQVGGGPPACTFSINLSHTVIDDLGGNLRIVVTAPGGCSWTAASNAGWLSVVVGQSRQGTGAVILDVAPNTGRARTGTVTIAGQTFTVSQGGGACGALDASSGARVRRSGLTYIPFSTYLYSESITVTNSSASVLHAPLYLVLVGVPNHFAPPNDNGAIGALQTTCFTPAGDNMFRLFGEDLQPGQSTVIPILFFTHRFFGGIQFQPKVLSGTPSH